MTGGGLYVALIAGAAAGAATAGVVGGRLVKKSETGTDVEIRRIEELIDKRGAKTREKLAEYDEQLRAMQLQVDKAWEKARGIEEEMRAARDQPDAQTFPHARTGEPARRREDVSEIGPASFAT